MSYQWLHLWDKNIKQLTNISPSFQSLARSGIGETDIYECIRTNIETPRRSTFYCKHILTRKPIYSSRFLSGG